MLDLARSAAAWIPVLLLGACATVGPGRSPTTGATLALRGELLLSDGAPVPRAPLRLACGQVIQDTASDERGRFGFAGLAGGARCRLSSPPAGFELAVTIDGRPLRATLPPVHRVLVEGELGASRARITLDETIPASTLRIEGGKLWLGTSSLALANAVGRELRHRGATVRVLSVERRPFLPLALRGAPARGQAASVPLLRPSGELTRLPVGQRSLVLLASCETLRSDTADELEAFLTSYGSLSGLRVTAVLSASESCSARAPGLPVLHGGPELLWALGAKAGDLVLVDENAQVLLARSTRRPGALEAVKALLDRSWPPFAATQRVSVAPAASVREAEADRLLGQAEAKIKVKRYQEAHELLDQVLALWPNLAEARKQRALTKAHLGDLSGALREVTWWRGSFGAESADDLLDEVQRCAKVSSLR